jgi:DMSO/TMAO reductase YedYZ molybdopterin-dependent catalytic subunit
MTIPLQVSRRRFFRSLGAIAGVLSTRAADTARQDMIVRSVRPEDFETPLAAFTSWITPTEHFFVRSHMSRPTVDVGTWRLTVDGEVSSPLTLTMDELKKLPAVELVSVIECAGNGRAFYKPGVAGMQWTGGGVGNGRWRGVRLADVLKKAGLKPTAKHVLFNGADTPPGTMPDFMRTVPVKKSLDPDTLLAFEMNGEPLPVSHGFPLRLIVPGWAGDSWVKWITNIQPLDKEFDGFWMKTAYRYPVRPVPPGAAVDPADLKPLEVIRPKSMIAGPSDGAGVGNGPVRIHGTAWAGESPITRVDVSTDSGRTWRAATLGKDKARYAWRLWELSWTPPGPGSYVLMARATDAAGATQPLAEDWNPSGYLWNVVQQVRVNVGTEAPAPQPPQSEIPAFPANVKQACIGCHEADIIAGQHLTRAQWDREVTKMTGWGATVKPGDRDGIIDFLFKNFGPR